MSPRLVSLLFPETPRDFPGRRNLKIALRAIHVSCAALCVGAYAFDVAGGDRTLWLVAALASGAALLALDVHETAAFFLQVRGAVVLAKLVLLALLPQCGGARWLLLVALMALSVLSSHAPGRIRHYQFAGRGRVRGSETHG